MPDGRRIEFCTEQLQRGDPRFKANLLCCIELCELAYKSQSEVEKALPGLGYHRHDVFFFENTLTKGFVIEFDDVVAVVFRGSVTWREWLNNFKFWVKYSPYGRIHWGFYQTIQQIGPPILRLVAPRIKSNLKLVVTGHSRGGALAVLFALMARLNGFHAYGIFTFGAPMFFDGRLAGVIDQMPVFRVVNKPDLVPKLPGCWASFPAFSLGFCIHQIERFRDACRRCLHPRRGHPGAD